MIRIAILAFIFSCGVEPSKSPEKPPSSPTNPGGQEVTWDDVKPIVNEQCALSGCHAGASFLATGRAMKASSSASLINNDRMPKKSSPNYDFWTNSKKSKLLSYLNN
jgi:hypothetical protein